MRRIPSSIRRNSQKADIVEKTQKLTGFIQIFDHILTWVSLVFGGAALAFMTLFSVWNVLIMRKFMNNPIIGAEDLLVLCLVVIVALAVGLGSRTGAHIEIEILESAMSVQFAKWSLIFVKIIGIGILLIMCEQLWHAGQKAVKFGETTQQLLISYEPFYYLLSVAVGVYGFVLILDIWQILRSGKVSKLKIGSSTL
tara:strand:+ start:645 stop:1235 length:591 start_codon:yes stop_codon:yes gene_type:complete